MKPGDLVFNPNTEESGGLTLWRDPALTDKPEEAGDVEWGAVGIVVAVMNIRDEDVDRGEDVLFLFPGPVLGWTWAFELQLVEDGT